MARHSGSARRPETGAAPAPPDHGHRLGDPGPVHLTGAETTRAGRVTPDVGGWDFRYATGDAVTGWDKVCAAAPGNARTAWERITSDPHHRDGRQHALKGSLAIRTVNGEDLEQWQYEVTGAGRLWYCIDERHRTVWLTEATPGHPKATE